MYRQLQAVHTGYEWTSLAFFTFSSISAASLIRISFSSIFRLRCRTALLITYCCFCLHDFNSFLAAVNSARIFLVVRSQSLTSVSLMIRANFSSICFTMSSCAGVLYLFFVHNTWPSVVSSVYLLVSFVAPVYCVELAGSVILVARASRGDLLLFLLYFLLVFHSLLFLYWLA